MNTRDNIKQLLNLFFFKLFTAQLWLTYVINFLALLNSIPAFWCW